MFSLARFDWRTFAAVVVVAVSVIVAMVLYADSDGPAGQERRPPRPTTPSGMARLVFAVWGNEAEVEAYKKIVDAYNKESEVVDVHVEAWPDPTSMLADIRSGEVTPDLYLLPRDELAETLEADRNRPLLDLLDARGVAFGDEFPRDAITAFSAEDDLQCMPYSGSPKVIYYNTDLIDFERMAARELPVPPEDREFWSLEMFRAAAAFASRPRKDTKGVYIEPTLRGLAPFVYAGGGKMFDDDDDPKSLALADERLRRRAAPDPRGAARPDDHPHQPAAAGAVRARVLRGRPARHDRRVPRPDAGAAAGPRPALRRDADARARRRRDHR